MDDKDRGIVDNVVKLLNETFVANGVGYEHGGVAMTFLLLQLYEKHGLRFQAVEVDGQKYIRTLGYGEEPTAKPKLTLVKK